MDFLSPLYEHLRQLGTQILQFMIFLLHIQFEGFRLETLMTSRLPELYLILFACLALCRIYFTYRLLCVFADTFKKFFLLLITGKWSFFAAHVFSYHHDSLQVTSTNLSQNIPEAFPSETGVTTNEANDTLPKTQ